MKPVTGVTDDETNKKRPKKLRHITFNDNCNNITSKHPRVMLSTLKCRAHSTSKCSGAAVHVVDDFLMHFVFVNNARIGQRITMNAEIMKGMDGMGKVTLT